MKVSRRYFVVLSAAAVTSRLFGQCGAPPSESGSKAGSLVAPRTVGYPEKDKLHRLE